MIFVDTGAWYAWYVVDDIDHKRAETWFRDADDRLVTTDYVLDELLTLLQVRGHGAIAIAAGEMLFSGGPCDLEFVQPEDVQQAWKVFSTYLDKGWSFTDCTSRIIMQRLNVTRAAAFDDHFRQFGTVTVEP